MIPKDFQDDLNAAMELTMLAQKRVKNGDMEIPDDSIEKREVLYEKASLLYKRAHYNNDGEITVTITKPSDKDLLADIMMLLYEIWKQEDTEEAI